MAPIKATAKRQHEAAKTAGKALVAKKARKDVDPKLKAVIEAVEASGDSLPDSCRAMLIAMLPDSLTVPADTRDANQTRLVAMVREVMELVRVKKQEAVGAEEQRVSEVAASKEGLVASASQAEAASAAAVEFSTTKKAQAAEAEKLLNSKNEMLKTALEAQNTGDAALETAESECSKLQTAIDGALRQLCSGDEWDAASASGHCQALMALIKNISTTDDSLLQSVPASFKKAPAERGDFDKMVIEQVEKTLKDRLAQLTSTLEAGSAGKAERAAAVEAAQGEVETAKSARMDTTESLSNAMAAQQEAAGALKEAQTKVKKFEPELKKTQAARDEKQVMLDIFQDGNMKAFAELESKVSASAEVAPQAGA
jgi:hypothetical protein